MIGRQLWVILRPDLRAEKTMRFKRAQFLIAMVLLASAPSLATSTVSATDLLPSWRDGQAKAAIVAFVDRVTDESSPDFVPVPERIATFDNDGTLWCEQPLYVQGVFLIDRARELAPQHPEWKEQEPFQAVLQGDLRRVATMNEQAVMDVLAATHAGMTVDEFSQTVTTWIATARHPTTGRLYTQMVYQPMLELLAYLRGNGFQTFIVSGGGMEFMRPWTEQVYGVPPQQVVGSSGKLQFEMLEEVPVLRKLAAVNLIDDGPGKPVGIQQHIGRRPIFAAGNSDGDLQMLQYTTIRRDANDRPPRFGLLIHHTDAEREWAYDRDSFVGRLDKALDQAPAQGWTVVSMKEDWRTIFAE